MDTNPNSNLIKLVIPMLSLLIATFSVSVMFAYEDFVKLYFSEIEYDESIQKELFDDFIENVIFAIATSGLILFGFRRFFKIKIRDVINKDQLKKFVVAISHNNQLLFNVIFTASLLIFAIISLFFAQEILLELLGIKTVIDPEQKNSWMDFGVELFFGLFFLVLATSTLRHTIRKISEHEEYEEVKPKQSRFAKIKNRIDQNPKSRILLYVVCIPFVFLISILFSGNVFVIINSISDTPIITFETYVISLFLFFIFLTHTRYVNAFQRINVKEHFEMLGSKYIIEERQILEKIYLFSIALWIGSSILLILYLVINPASNTTLPDNADPFAMFFLSMFFGSMLMFGIVHLKLKSDNKKKQFRTFVAVGFFQSALDEKDKLKDHLRYGLQSYSNFFKQHHTERLKDIEQIIISILSKENPEKSIKNVINAWNSSKEYDGLNVISDLMDVKSHEILVSNRLILKIKDWGTFILTFVILVFAIMQYLK